MKYLVTFTQKILNEKLHFCAVFLTHASVYFIISQYFMVNFLLRRIFCGNLNEVVSLVEIALFRFRREKRR